MPIDSIITGPGAGKQAYVVDDGLLVSNIPCPPMRPQKCKIWSEFLTEEGGTHDLGIDGSAVPVNFFIRSDVDNDIYITKLNFIMGYGTAGRLYNFADSGVALPNGVEISYFDTEGTQTVIALVQVNYEFLRYATGTGIVPTAWELRSLGAVNDYGYMCTIDLSAIMPPHGIKIDRGSNQRASVLIQDDCTDADLFDCRAFGFERFE